METQPSEGNNASPGAAGGITGAYVCALATSCDRRESVLIKAAVSLESLTLNKKTAGQKESPEHALHLVLRHASGRIAGGKALPHG